MQNLSYIFKASWLRKLIGKPAFLTIADCESEARRIQFQAAAFSSSASRIHSDFDALARFTASATALCSSGDNRACTRTALTWDFGSFGLPILVFINTLCKRIMDEKMRDLTCKPIEIDEIWGFIGAKQKNAKRAGAFGDVWTFFY